MSTYLESSHLASECRHCVLTRLCWPVGRYFVGAQNVKLRQGDRLSARPARYVYVLLEGRLRICHGASLSDRPIILDRVTPGEAVGLEAIEEKRYLGEITAEETSKLCRVPIVYLRKSLERSPGLGFYLARLLSRRLACGRGRPETAAVRHFIGGD